MEETLTMQGFLLVVILPISWNTVLTEYPGNHSGVLSDSSSATDEMELSYNCHAGDDFSVAVDSLDQKRVFSWHGSLVDPVAKCSLSTGGRNLVMTVSWLRTTSNSTIAYR